MPITMEKYIEKEYVFFLKKKLKCLGAASWAPLCSLASKARDPLSHPLHMPPRPRVIEHRISWCIPRGHLLSIILSINTVCCHHSSSEKR